MDDVKVLESAPETAAPASAPEAAAPSTASPAPQEATTAATPSASGAEPAIEWPADADEPETGAPEHPAAAPGHAETTPTPTPETPRQGAERWGAPALTRLLKETPDLAKLAEANPRLRGQLYQIARRSGELAEYQQVLPTLNAAREARQNAAALAEMDRAYFGDRPEEFLSRLWDAQARLDPQTGQRVSTGAYERVLQFAHNALFDYLGDQAESHGDERLSQAVQAVREHLGWNGPSRHSRAENRPEPKLPPEVRAEIARGRQAMTELGELRREAGAQRAQAEQAWLDTTAAEAANQITGFVSGLLAKTAFTEFEKQAITREFVEAIDELAEQDPAHRATLDELYQRQGASPEARRRLVGRTLGWVKANAREALEPILARAAAARRSAQAEREAKRATARREPAAAGAEPGLARLGAREQVQALAQRLGRKPTDLDILNAL